MTTPNGTTPTYTAADWVPREGLDVLELDRVLDASPDEVDDHRRGLEEARRKRLADIGAATERLLVRIVAAAGTANEKVLLHPAASPKAVRASERVSGTILDLHGLLGLETARDDVEVRRWSSAAGDVRDRALETGGHGVSAVRRGGGAAVGRVRDGTGGARRTVQALPGRVRSARRRARDDREEAADD